MDNESLVNEEEENNEDTTKLLNNEEKEEKIEEPKPALTEDAKLAAEMANSLADCKFDDIVLLNA